MIITNLEEIAPFQSFNAKILVGKVTVIDDGGVEPISVLHDDVVMKLGDHWCFLAVRCHVVQIADDLTEDFLRLLVKI